MFAGWWGAFRVGLNAIFQQLAGPFAIAGSAMLTAWFADMLGVYEGVRRALCWLLKWALDLMVYGIDEFLGGLPAIPADFNAPLVVEWLGIGNRYFPVSEGAALMGAYLTLYVSFVVVRFIVKLIPTVG